MAERYVVLPPASLGTEYAELEQAEQAASAVVDKERGARVVVKVISVIRPRSAPNVDVERMEESGHA